MTKHLIKWSEDGHVNCKCGGKLQYQDKWDKQFDRYENNTPSFDEIYVKIYNDDIPKYLCEDCKNEYYVLPDYKFKK